MRRLLLVRPKAELMGEFGRKRLTVELDRPLAALPDVRGTAPVGSGVKGVAATLADV